MDKGSKQTFLRRRYTDEESLTSLDNKKMQIKIIRYQFKITMMAIIRQIIIRVHKDVEKLESLCLVGGNVNGAVTLEKKFSTLFKCGVCI